MLNFRFWNRRFGSDPDIVGKTVVLNARVVTIIGVADARTGTGDEGGFYLPLEMQPALLRQGDWLREGAEPWLTVGARLRPGVSPRQAQAEMDILANALANARRQRGPSQPEAGLREQVDRTGVFVSPGGENPGKAKRLRALALAVVLGVSMILLIACSNLANLLLARAVVRRREIGVRLSLGASRARLVSQLLTESLLLASTGGVTGLLISRWLAKGLLVMLNAPAGFDVRLDYRVVLYALLLSLATGVSFGLAPAMAATKTNLALALHGDGLSPVARSRSARIWSARNMLIVVPLAVSLLLLMGAGLALRHVQRIYLDGPGLDTRQLIGVGFRLSQQGYDEATTRQFQESLRQRIAAMPGVTSVALAGAMPLFHPMGNADLLAEGTTLPLNGRRPPVAYNIVSAEYFSTAGIPMLRGRAFTASDREGAAAVAVVSQLAARTLWAGEDALGKRFRRAEGNTLFEVIGVVADLPNPGGGSDEALPIVYVPYSQGRLFLRDAHTETPPYQMQFLIRCADAALVKAALRQEVRAADASLRVTIQTLDEMLRTNVGPLQSISVLLSALGGLALVMASIGIYGILAYAVSQRTREIGIRIALGAQRREILELVMQRTLTLIAWGIGLGLAGALALNRIFASQLADLGELDAVTCVSVSLLLGAVALLASYLPARKALGVNPVQALRYE